jgi:hypothetical protein
MRRPPTSVPGEAPASVDCDLDVPDRLEILT